MNSLNIKKGFTLIEVIVVIAIIAILTAIAVPSFFSSIESTKITADRVTINTLNKITPLYRMNDITSDPFNDKSKTEKELILALVESGFLSSPVEPVSKDAKFLWNIDKQLWEFSKSASINEPIIPYLLMEVDYQLGWSKFVIGKLINETEKNIQIPEGIRAIQGGESTAAFYEKGLKSVVLPSTLTDIYSHAFYGNSLNEIIIPEKVTFIGTRSFYNNPIKKITMTSQPQLVTIQDRVFGIGYTESKIITDSFKQAYTNGGPGTYEWIDNKWLKTN